MPLDTLRHRLVYVPPHQLKSQSVTEINSTFTHYHNSLYFLKKIIQNYLLASDNAKHISHFQLQFIYFFVVVVYLFICLFLVNSFVLCLLEFSFKISLCSKSDGIL